jgi:hypothetical protein
MPYGQAFAAQVFVSNEWISSENDDFDWGLIILDRFVGDVTGAFGYGAPDFGFRDPIQYTSYPGAMASGLSPIWSPGEVHCDDSTMVYHSAETSDGSSGGGIHFNFGSSSSDELAIAVNTGTDWDFFCSPLYTHARSTRLNATRVGEINAKRDDPSIPVINDSYVGQFFNFSQTVTRPTAVRRDGSVSEFAIVAPNDSVELFRTPNFQWNIGGNILGQVDLISRDTLQLDLFARVNNGAAYAPSQLCTKARNSSGVWWPSLSGWVCFSDTNIVEPPTSVATRWDRLHVFSHGVNGRVIEKPWTNSGGWTSPVDLGGNTRHPAALVSRAELWWDLFIRDSGSGQICTKSRNDSTYMPSQTGWSCMGAGSTIASAPTVASSGTNRLDVLGVTTSGNVIQMFWRGGSWQGPVNLGGTMLQVPVAIVSRAPNQIDLFAIGVDGGLKTKAHNGSSWWPSSTGWASLGGNAFLDVDASAPSSSRLHVFMRGRDTSIRWRYWDGTWH